MSQKFNLCQLYEIIHEKFLRILKKKKKKKDHGENTGYTVYNDMLCNYIEKTMYRGKCDEINARYFTCLKFILSFPESNYVNDRKTYPCQSYTYIKEHQISIL